MSPLLVLLLLLLCKAGREEGEKKRIGSDYVVCCGVGDSNICMCMSWGKADGRMSVINGDVFLGCSVQSDDIGAHINVGRTYNNLKMYKEAEDAYLKVRTQMVELEVKRMKKRIEDDEKDLASSSSSSY